MSEEKQLSSQRECAMMSVIVETGGSERKCRISELN